jgi:hypothetical protein
VLHYREQLALSMQREALERGEQDSMVERANTEKQAAQVGARGEGRFARPSCL